MESAFEALGVVSLIVLVLIGLASGWLAGLLAGRQRARYFAVGVVGAVAAPVILAALGVGLLAAGGLLALILVAALGAILVLVLARALFD